MEMFAEKKTWSKILTMGTEVNYINTNSWSHLLPLY